MSGYDNNGRVTDPEAWMAERWPNTQKLDVNWTMERYDYPAEVREWIMSSPDWRLISMDNGGTYERVVHAATETSSIQEAMSIAIQAPPPVAHKPPTTPNPVETDQSNEESSKEFAKKYQETQFAAAMDTANKEALDVWAEQGISAAVAHMFKRPESEGGGTLSYSEMRSRFG